MFNNVVNNSFSVLSFHIYNPQGSLRHGIDAFQIHKGEGSFLPQTPNLLSSSLCTCLCLCLASSEGLSLEAAKIRSC